MNFEGEVGEPSDRLQNETIDIQSLSKLCDSIKLILFGNGLSYQYKIYIRNMEFWDRPFDKRNFFLPVLEIALCYMRQLEKTT